MNPAKLSIAVVMGTLSLVSFTACDRLDDPPLPQTHHGLAALGATSAVPAASRSPLAEPDPIIVRPSDHSVTTASQFFPEHRGDDEILISDLRYDSSDEITVRGPVLGKRFVPLAGGHTAEIVELMPGENFIDVMLGTTEYFYQHHIDVGITDNIMVRGDVVRHNGRDLMLAREVTWRGATYAVRDRNGRPVWRTNESGSNLDGLSLNEHPRWQLWW